MRATLILMTLALLSVLATPGSSLGVPEVPDRVFVLVMSGTAFNGFSYPASPLLEATVGDDVQVTVLVPPAAEAHTFHMHGHPWWSEDDGRFLDTVLLEPGDSHTFKLVAGGPLAAAGDWMYHCHVDEHMTGGMWGVFRVTAPGDASGVPLPLPLPAPLPPDGTAHAHH